MIIVLKVEIDSTDSDVVMIGDSSSPPPKSRPLLKPTSTADHDDALEQDDVLVTAEQKEKIMKKFYNFEKESVYIPEEVKNRASSRQIQKKADKENKSKSVDEVSKDATVVEVDVEEVFSNFVAESSSEEEEEENEIIEVL